MEPVQLPSSFSRINWFIGNLIFQVCCVITVLLSYNVGFLFKLSNNVVKGCWIVFGRINPNLVHDTKTEGLLKGQKLYDNILHKSFKFLNTELLCDNIPPGASPKYRKKLLILYFYKVKSQKKRWVCQILQIIHHIVSRSRIRPLLNFGNHSIQ